MELNKIYNMDCLEGLKQLDDESIDLIITDPPYKVMAKGCSGNFGGMFKKEINKKGKVFNNNDIEIDDWLPILYNKLKNGKHIYIMTNNFNLINYLNKIEEYGFKFIKCLIWDKQNKIMGRFYMGQFEYIIFARKGEGVKINNCGDSDLISIPNKKLKKNGVNLHDTEKPVRLIDKLILNSSNKGDLVLEPFVGIGSTIISSIKNGRNYIGFEIDKNYFDIAEQRINDEKSKITLDKWQ